MGIVAWGIILTLVVLVILLIMFAYKIFKLFRGIDIDLELLAKTNSPQCVETTEPSACAPFQEPLSLNDTSPAVIVGKFIAYAGSLLPSKGGITVSSDMLNNIGTHKLVTWSGDANVPMALVYNNYVVFRGTLTSLDFVKDMMVAETVKFDPTNDKVEVHKGFNEIYQEIKSDLMSTLDKTQLVKIMGHSLGCALGLLLAYDLMKASYNVAVVNFAPPRTGNSAFANFLYDNVLAFINECDVVPTLPPAYVVSDDKIYQYMHAGEIKHISYMSTDLLSNHNMLTYYTATKSSFQSKPPPPPSS